MLNHSLDRVYAALADGSRRQMVDRLSHGPATVKELAEPLTMSLPAVLQHLRVLEESGLVRSEKAGRVRTCRLEPAALTAAEQWIADRRVGWRNRLDRLDAYLQLDTDQDAAGHQHAPGHQQADGYQQSDTRQQPDTHRQPDSHQQ